MDEPLPLPKYKSIKVVGALKIARVEIARDDEKHVKNPTSWLLYFEDKRFPSRIGPAVGRPTPAPGWYLVVYSEGYESYSPGPEFERGYLPLDSVPDEAEGE